MKKAAIYNPYWDTLGGGERYSATFAQVLAELGYKVHVQWGESGIVGKLEKRFGLKLDSVEVVENVKRGDGYDVCFWVSDGSLPMFRARNNILHFQVPFCDVSGKSLINRMKMYRVNSVVCNSNFTKRVIDGEFGVDSKVLYPPVDVSSIKPKRKQNLIFYVGRFSQLKQSKRQDVLIDAFAEFYDKGNKKWKMVLAGGVEVGVGDYLKRLRKMAKGYPISIVESPSYKKLVSYFGRAKIYWSAAGYGIDAQREPERLEHFGITLVEAMSAGQVVFAFNAGGHKEIVCEGKNGYLWKSKSDLIDKTISVLGERERMKEISTTAVKDSRKYGYEEFKRGVKKLL